MLPLKCKHTFDIFRHLVKKRKYRFLKYSLAAKLLKETYHRCFKVTTTVASKEAGKFV